MALAGYSGTPLIKKLGIREDMKILVLNAPNGYPQWLERDISKQLAGKKTTPDLVHLFVKTNREFENEMKNIQKFCLLNPNIAIWVSWYKKSAGIATDMTEDVIRDYALQNGLVDIKVCAVTGEWSGLKLVVPRNKR
jgi:hypothetical protein